MSMAAIRRGLGTALREIPGCHVHESAFALSNPTPPHLFAYLDRQPYDRTLQRGYDELYWTVVALVSLGGFDVGAQLLLDRLMAPAGDMSVKAALEADPTLGGACSTLRVEELDSWGPYRRENAGDALGAQWHVYMLARGTE